MAFAVRIVNFEGQIEQCTSLVEDPSYRENYEKLKSLITPPVREIVLKSSKKTVKIGGEYVLI